MTPLERTTLGFLLGVLAATGLPAFAASGRVVSPEGKPVPDARVCHMQFGIEQLCTSTRPDGRFEILDNAEMPLRVVADGYLPEERPGVGQHDPIVLRRAPILLVRLVDAESGAAIEKAEVFVRRAPTNGETPPEEKGPFLANRAGVRIQRLLDPGDVSVIGRADGYEESSPRVVSLEGGKETDVTLQLTKRKSPQD